MPAAGSPPVPAVPQLRVAIVGDVGHPWSHTILFAHCLNGLCAEEAAARGLPLPGLPAASGARAVALWSPDARAGQEAARALGLAWVMRLADVPSVADGAVLSDDQDQERLRITEWAETLIAAGTRNLLVDKALAERPAQARQLVAAAARHQVNLLAGSGLRWSLPLEKLARDAATDRLLTGEASVPNGRILFYGSHAVDPLLRVWDAPAAWVETAGPRGRHTITIGGPDGRVLTCHVVEGARYAFEYALCGARGRYHATVEGEEVYRCHARFAAAFVQMAVSGRMPVPYAALSAAAEIVAAAVESEQAGGRRIPLRGA